MSASYAAHNGAMPCADPRHMLARAPMRWQQIMAIGFCALLNALDGYDVLSISFASPGIAAQWHVARAALGIVLSMEIIGMGVGSVLLGRLADRIGRVPVVIGCLAVMALGMLATTQAPSIAVLVALFGHAPADLHLLALAAGAAAFFTNGGIVGLYALIAGSFPASLRAGGSGLVIGIGRSGAAVGPIVAGFLFQAGFGLGLVAALMALGSGLSAVILALMPKRPPHQTD